MSIEAIYNYVRADERIITGGHPTAEQLQTVADEGVTAVINLATYTPGRSWKAKRSWCSHWVWSTSPFR
ncbi:MAG: hypothetical protein R3C44_15665 [Chloroflexota bacterium]